jgi:hypothetical protein
MRTLSILRAIVLAAAVMAPLTQAALAEAADSISAERQQQQALANGNATASFYVYGVGPYSDPATAPSVGD